MKILDFDLEGSHFIIEADISLRQKADDNMESHWPRYFFENTQVYNCLLYTSPSPRDA